MGVDRRRVLPIGSQFSIGLPQLFHIGGYMSWNALRFRKQSSFRFERCKGRTRDNHHVPPKSRGGTRTVEVETVKHRAYHILFANASCIEDCIAILRREWWPDPHKPAGT